MRSKEFYPFIRGKPNPLIHKTNNKQTIHPGKPETLVLYDIIGQRLPRGNPLGKMHIDSRGRNSLTGNGTKAEIFIRGWPLMVGDYLPRGEPQGLKNCSRSQEAREWLDKTFFNKCRPDVSGHGEIFRKGGIQAYLPT